MPATLSQTTCPTCGKTVSVTPEGRYTQHSNLRDGAVTVAEIIAAERCPSSNLPVR